MENRKFLFAEPPEPISEIALDDKSLQRVAFSLAKDELMNVEWKSIVELSTIEKADSSTVYVLYEFFGDVYVHLKSLGCNIIGPLVLKQAIEKGLAVILSDSKWALTLYGKIVSAACFKSQTSVNEVRDKVIKLGGIFRESVSSACSIVIVGYSNSKDVPFKYKIGKDTLVLTKEWLWKVYAETIELESNIEQFFHPNFIEPYIAYTGSTDESTSFMPSEPIPPILSTASIPHQGIPHEDISHQDIPYQGIPYRGIPHQEIPQQLITWEDPKPGEVLQNLPQDHSQTRLDNINTVDDNNEDPELYHSDGDKDILRKLYDE